MNRTAVAALTVAALLGGTGGAVAAVVRGDRAPASPGTHTAADPTPSPQRTPTRSTPSPSATTPSQSPSRSADTPSASPGTSTPAAPTETNEPLLYAAGGVIHDGDRSAAFKPRGRITRLVRVQDGWLAATTTSERSAEVQLWHVRASKDPVRIAGVTDWDVNATGSEVTAYDFETGQARVWGLRDDLPMGSYATPDGQAMTPFFVGGDVYISDQTGHADSVSLWNVQTGETAQIRPAYRIDGVSPGGSYMTGGLGDSGASTYGCRFVRSTPLKKYPVSWKTCDWHSDENPTRFSPDGTKLLLVPNDAKPLEPTTYGIFDITDGPSKPYAEVPLPKGTRGAEFADNSHLYVYGSDDTASSGSTWVKTCDFKGTCSQTVTSASALVVGSGV